MARGRGGRGGRGGGPDYMDIIDIQILATPEFFLVNNGIVTSSGSQIMFQGKSDALTTEQAQSATQINFTITGQKVQAKGDFCYCFTILAGSFLILPLLFMCCQWWKNIVHPKFALDFKTYQQIVNWIRKCPNLTFLSLNLYDNNLTKQKLQLLAQGISQSRINRVLIMNNCLESNYKCNEYSDFQQNIECFRRLNLTGCQLQWKSKVVSLSGTGVIGGGGYNQMTQANLGYQPKYNNQINSGTLGYQSNFMKNANIM